jgi:hypothetical protein
MMLAPRKVLWSTPDAAIEKMFEIVPLDGGDVVVDLGCGDGRVLLRWAELYTAASDQVTRRRSDDKSTSNSHTTSMPTFVGIDVDPERIQAAEAVWMQSVSTQRIAANIPHQFYCANAVEKQELWRDTATVLYVYLTARGMRQVRPLLNHGDQNYETRQNLRVVVSFMNPLSNANLVRRERVLVPHQPDAAWPLYFYKI